VGLYHSLRQASQLGYRLALAANQPGMLCFVLTREAGVTWRTSVSSFRFQGFFGPVSEKQKARVERAFNLKLPT